MTTVQQLAAVSKATVLHYACVWFATQAMVCYCHRQTAKADVSAGSQRRELLPDLPEKKDPLPVQRSEVIQRPEVVQNLTVGLGERAVFKCKVDNLGTRTVTWRKMGDGHPLTIGHFLFAADTRMSVDSNQWTNEWSLIIQDVRMQDEGIYQCYLTIKDRQEFTNDIRLIVRTAQIEGTAYVDAGSAISLLCTALRRVGLPWSGLQWFQNGRRIETNISAGITVTEQIADHGLTGSRLTIKAADTSMAGDYVCKSSDDDLATTIVYVLDDFLMKRRNANKEISAERITGNHDSNAAANQRSTSHLTYFTTLTLAFILNCHSKDYGYSVDSEIIV